MYGRNDGRTGKGGPEARRSSVDVGLAVFAHYWADLEEPQIYHLRFHIFAVLPENTNCPRMGLRIGLRG